MHTEDVVDLGTEPVERIGRCNRDSHDNPHGPMQADGTDGSKHGVAGSQSIIDEDDGLPCKNQRGSRIAVSMLATKKLLALSSNGGIDS